MRKIIAILAALGLLLAATSSASAQATRRPVGNSGYEYSGGHYAYYPHHGPWYA